MIKLPPDKLVLKIRLSKILKNERDVKKLFDVTDRTNKIVIYAYQFLPSKTKFYGRLPVNFVN